MVLLRYEDGSTRTVEDVGEVGGGWVLESEGSYFRCGEGVPAGRESFRVFPLLTFEVDLASTMLEGVGFLNVRDFPPPVAKHGMVFRGIEVGDAIRVVDDASRGKWEGFLLPRCRQITRVHDRRPLVAERPRTPPGDLDARKNDPIVQQTWDDFFAKQQAMTDDDIQKDSDAFHAATHRHDDDPPHHFSFFKDDSRE
mmetsp:Transcript_23011/g.74022  ORF Transcript_23011/g.74022 Transcript_23011/m.74022 type:complete len:197 (-) Transcript_23011:1349-1939(-)